MTGAHMDSKGFQEWFGRANKMVDALKAETNRGRACVADALLDELVKDLFAKRFVADKKTVKEILSDGQALGNHSLRLKLAYLNGWIGPDTYADCGRIHRVRNKMAHQLDVDTFDHEQVRDLIDEMKVLADITITVKGTPKHLNLTRREDRFLVAAMIAVQRIFWFLQNGNHAQFAKDPPIVSLPKP